MLEIKDLRVDKALSIAIAMDLSERHVEEILIQQVNAVKQAVIAAMRKQIVSINGSENKKTLSMWQ